MSNTQEEFPQAPAEHSTAHDEQRLTIITKQKGLRSRDSTGIFRAGGQNGRDRSIEAYCALHHTYTGCWFCVVPGFDVGCS